MLIFEFLVGLANVDVTIEEEAKALILLSFLPSEDYETLILTLFNGKQSLSYHKINSALVNRELRRKEKKSSTSTLTQALTVRGRGFNQKGKGERERSKSRPGFRDLKKKQCAFCKEIRHWNVDCPRIKDKNKYKESKTEENLTLVISTQAGTSQAGESDSDSSVFSFSIITLTIGYSGDSERVLDIEQPIMCARTGIYFLALRS